MKRASLIAITLTYLFSSIGVSAKSMYCLGMLKSTTISYLSTPKQEDCKMAEKMKNCCKTKKQFFKVKDQHYHSVAFDLLTKLFPVLSQFTFGNDTIALSISSRQHWYYSNAPPAFITLPAYTLNCNYRI